MFIFATKTRFLQQQKTKKGKFHNLPIILISILYFIFKLKKSAFIGLRTRAPKEKAKAAIYQRLLAVVL